MWLFYCHTRYFGSVHCFCGLKILILNGSGLQIQTSGTTRTSAGSEGHQCSVNIRWVGRCGCFIATCAISGQFIAARRIENPYTQWVWITNPDQLHAAEHPRGRVFPCWEHPRGRSNGTQPNISGVGYDFFADYASFLIIYFINNQIVETFQGLTT